MSKKKDQEEVSEGPENTSGPTPAQGPAAGEAVATVGIGLPLLYFLRSRPRLVRLLGGRED